MDVVKVYRYALLREKEGKRFFEDCAGRWSTRRQSRPFVSWPPRKKSISNSSPASSTGSHRGTDPEEHDLSDSFFLKRAASEALDQKVLESMVADLPVLRMAYLIERDFVEFYSVGGGKGRRGRKEGIQDPCRLGACSREALQEPP